MIKTMTAMMTAVMAEDDVLLPVRRWTLVYAQVATPAAIMNAMKKGVIHKL